MTDTPPVLTAALPAAEVLDQVRRQLAALDELTGIGLEAARALVKPGSGEPGEPAAPAVIALAYARVSRAVRLAVLLQQRLIKDLSAGLASIENIDESADQDDDAPLSPGDQRKDRVARIGASAVGAG